MILQYYEEHLRLLYKRKLRLLNFPRRIERFFSGIFLSDL